MSISVSASDAGGGQITINWSTTALTGYHRTGTVIAVTGLGQVYNSSGQSGSITVYVGYSTTVTVDAAVLYDNNTAGQPGTSSTASTSVTTGAAPAPPPAPSTPTVTGSTDLSTHASSLSWTNVGASGYQVLRDGVLIYTTGLTSYVDTPGDTAVHQYQVQAYNSSTGGTTYSGFSNIYTSITSGIYVRVAGALVRKPTAKPVYVKWAGTVKVT